MKSILLAAFLLVFSLPLVAQVASTAAPGPFSVGEKDITFTDNTLASPNVDARIWYPATSNGSGTPVAAGQFAILAFGHGFNLNYLDYEQICGHLASWGYIVLSPDVQNGFNVSHGEFARELAACLNYMLGEGSNSNSEFFQKTDTMTGVLGHSMGGGASGLVPSVYPSIDAVSGFAAAETNPSAIAALGGYSGPFQTISGSSDNTAPENTNQTPMYNAAQGDKQWLSITGGAHCKFTDGTTVCDFVSSGGSVTREFQIYLSKKYATAFFNYHLKGDMDALPFICGDSVQADISASRVTNTTNIACAVSIDQVQETGLIVYPNPASDLVKVESEFPIQVFSAQGIEINPPMVQDGNVNTLDVSGLSPGVYFLRSGGRIQAVLVGK